MLRVDLNFSYKFNLRFLLINKLNIISNTYCVPSVTQLVLFFPITRIEDVDHVQSYNYAYLFKFFFGKKAFLTRQRSFFNLGKWTYSFSVNIIFRHSFVYEHLFLLINDILPRIDRPYLNFGIFSKDLNIYYLIIKDLNVFSEKKTNLGLFYLESNLNYHIFCKGIDFQARRFYYEIWN